MSTKTEYGRQNIDRGKITKTRQQVLCKHNRFKIKHNQ